MVTKLAAFLSRLSRGDLKESGDLKWPGFDPCYERRRGGSETGGAKVHILNRVRLQSIFMKKAYTHAGALWF